MAEKWLDTSALWKIHRELFRGGSQPGSGGYAWVVRTPRGTKATEFSSWRDAMDWVTS